jgi:hypothetical protein
MARDGTELYLLEPELFANVGGGPAMTVPTAGDSTEVAVS